MVGDQVFALVNFKSLKPALVQINIMVGTTIIIAGISGPQIE